MKRQESGDRRQNMAGVYRSLLLSLCVGLACVSTTFAETNDMTCRELLKNESDLEKVYEVSEMVFIAEIDPRVGVNQQIYNYRVFDPILKGAVPGKGVITFADGCAPRARTAIYLFFLDSLREKIAGFNAIFFSLPDGGPGYTWIADWVEEKIGENQKTEVRSLETDDGI